MFLSRKKDGDTSSNVEKTLEVPSSTESANFLGSLNWESFTFVRDYLVPTFGEGNTNWILWFITFLLIAWVITEVIDLGQLDVFKFIKKLKFGFFGNLFAISVILLILYFAYHKFADNTVSEWWSEYKLSSNSEVKLNFMNLPVGNTQERYMSITNFANVSIPNGSKPNTGMANTVCGEIVGPKALVSSLKELGVDYHVQYTTSGTSNRHQIELHRDVKQIMIDNKIGIAEIAFTLTSIRIGGSLEKVCPYTTKK